MADHSGYVYITPTGLFITRSPYIGHGQYTDRIGLSSHIDCAWLHPTPNIMYNKAYDWSTLLETFEGQTVAQILDECISLPAMSYQRIELINVHKSKVESDGTG